MKDLEKTINFFLDKTISLICYGKYDFLKFLFILMVSFADSISILSSQKYIV